MPIAYYSLFFVYPRWSASPFPGWQAETWYMGGGQALSVTAFAVPPLPKGEARGAGPAPHQLTLSKIPVR